MQMNVDDPTYRQTHESSGATMSFVTLIVNINPIVCGGNVHKVQFSGYNDITILGIEGTICVHAFETALMCLK